MKTANEKIFDELLKHQIFMLKYGESLSAKLAKHITKTEKELFSEIVRMIDRVDGNRTLTGKAGRKWQKELEAIIKGLRDPAWSEIYESLNDELKEFAVASASTTVSAVATASPVVLDLKMPPADKLFAIINSQPFEGDTLKGWLKNTEAADARRLLKAAKIGVIQGRTPIQIARDIVGTQAAKYKDGASRKAVKDLESVILTLNSGIQNEARQAVYEANSDIIKKEKFVATLDSRTTLECASNDGKIFKAGEGPYPPLHFRCRSLRVPVLEFDVVGDRGFDAGVEKDILNEYAKDNRLGRIGSRGELPRGHKGKFDAFARKRKRDFIGQVPSDTSFNEWLKGQSTSFQNEYLGPTRAKLFRSGKYTLDKFVSASGETITLDQLTNRA